MEILSIAHVNSDTAAACTRGCACTNAHACDSASVLVDVVVGIGVGSAGRRARVHRAVVRLGSLDRLDGVDLGLGLRRPLALTRAWKGGFGMPLGFFLQRETERES